MGRKLDSRIIVRLDKETKEDLEDEAFLNNRSLSEEIRARIRSSKQKELE